MLCPVHGDVNASLLVDLDENFWHCFGCKHGGAAFDFVKFVEPNMDAMEMYKKFYSILGGQESKSPVQIKREKSRYLRAAQDYYFNLKTEDWRHIDGPEKEYMQERGFTAATLAKVKMKRTYGRNYPLVFPMNDMGVFKGWVSRTTDPVVAEKRKYLYNKGFSRRDTIVGKYDNEVVMLVEGYMDYLKAKQFGATYVGAILGWRITAEQIQKLKDQGVKYIISALDGTELLRENFIVVPFCYKKGIKDIGEMTQTVYTECERRTGLQYKKIRRAA